MTANCLCICTCMCVFVCGWWDAPNYGVQKHKQYSGTSEQWTRGGGGETHVLCVAVVHISVVVCILAQGMYKKKWADRKVPPFQEKRVIRSTEKIKPHYSSARTVQSFLRLWTELSFVLTTFVWCLLYFWHMHVHIHVCAVFVSPCWSHGHTKPLTKQSRCWPPAVFQENWGIA